MRTFIAIILLAALMLTGPVSCFAQQSNAATGRDTIIVIGSGLEPEMNNDIKSHVAEFVGAANGGDRIHIYSGSEHSPVATITIPEATGRSRFRDRSLVSNFRKLSRFLERNTGSENPGQFGFYRMADTYWSVSDGKRDCQVVFIGDPVFHEPRRYGFWSFRDGRFPSDNSVIAADSTSPYINSQRKPVPDSVDVSIVPVSSNWGDSKLHREHIIRFLRLAMQQQLGGRLNRVTDKMSVALDPATTRIFRREVQPDDHPMVGMWTIRNGVHQLVRPESERNESDRVGPSPVEGNSGSTRQPGNEPRSTTGRTEETSLRPGENSPTTGRVNSSTVGGVDSTQRFSGSQPADAEGADREGVVDRNPTDPGASTSREDVSDPRPDPGIGNVPERERDNARRAEIAAQQRRMQQMAALENAGAERQSDVESLRAQNSDLQEALERGNQRSNEIADTPSLGAPSIDNTPLVSDSTEPRVVESRPPVLSQARVNEFRGKIGSLDPEIQDGVRRILAAHPDAIVILHQSYTKCSHAEVDLVIEDPTGSLSENSGPMSFGEIIQTKRGSVPNGTISLREVQTLCAIWPEDVSEVTLWSNAVFSHHPVHTRLIAIKRDVWAEATFEQQKQLDSAASRDSPSAWAQVGLLSMLQTGFTIYE